MSVRMPHAGASLTMDRDSFGMVLRAGRERRHVSLEVLSRETRVRREVWEALEANDFAAWPRGIYARSLIRQYAERVDLDPDGLVNEFCRLFPNGDRRSEPLFREYAAIIAHELSYREPLSAPCRRVGDVSPRPADRAVAVDAMERATAALWQWTRRRLHAAVAMYRAARAWTFARGVARGA